jgi:hypothetical protein
MKRLAPLLLLLAHPALAVDIKKPSCDPNADIEALVAAAKARWSAPAQDEIETLFAGEPYDEQAIRTTITKSVELCQRKFREYHAFIAGQPLP